MNRLRAGAILLAAELACVQPCVAASATMLTWCGASLMAAPNTA